MQDSALQSVQLHPELILKKFQSLQKKNGELYWEEASISPIRDAQGIITHFVAVKEDITKRKQAEKALRLQSEIAANMSESVHLVRVSDGVIVYTNPRFEELFGYGPAELVGEHISIVNAPGDKSPEETANSIVTALHRDGYWQGEVKNIKKDGTLFWCYASVSSFNHHDYGDVWISVHADITERRRAEEELRKHRDHLEELVEERTTELKTAHDHLLALTRVKDEFIARISHELRMPITNLKLHQHLLGVHPSQLDEHLAMLQRETERLHRIIEDLLLLSSLDQDEVALDIKSIDLNRLINQLVGDRTPLAQKQGLDLSFSEQTDLPLVRGDGELLGRVLSILLTNALSYTPTGGRIEVSTHSRNVEGRLWSGFSVSDTGPGIPADEQERLFERFFRGRVSLETGTPGSGLGLATAKEIMKRHQGKMEIASEDVPGKGVTFSVWLPVEE